MLVICAMRIASQEQHVWQHVRPSLHLHHQACCSCNCSNVRSTSETETRESCSQALYLQSTPTEASSQHWYLPSCVNLAPGMPTEDL